MARIICPSRIDPLSDADLSLVARWIDEGAHMPRDVPPVFSPAPTGLRCRIAIQYQNAVKVLADDFLRRRLVGCEVVAGNDRCVSGFLEQFARLVFRGTPSRAERARYRKLLLATSKKGGLTVGMELVVVAMLQTPRFIYLSETGTIDPAHHDRIRFTGLYR